MSVTLPINEGVSSGSEVALTNPAGPQELRHLDRRHQLLRRPSEVLLKRRPPPFPRVRIRGGIRPDKAGGEVGQAGGPLHHHRRRCPRPLSQRHPPLRRSDGATKVSRKGREAVTGLEREDIFFLNFFVV